jgi:4-amino-4-deoxy-L-arabinose transferase
MVEEQNMPCISWWRHVSLAMLAAAVLIFSFAGTRPIMDTSEARYAETAREMAFEGHWLIPHLGGTPHLTKPPLTYWLVGVSMRMFGATEWAARLPIGLAALGTVVLTALCARALFNPRTGILAAWLQGLALVPCAAAGVITTDTMLAFFETGYMWCAWLLLTKRLDLRERLGWQLAFYGFLAGGFLTKAQAALVPILPLLVFVLWKRKHITWKNLWSFPGFLLFLALVLPWPMIVLIKVPQALRVWHEEIIANVFEEADHDFSRVALLLILVFGSFPSFPILLAELRRCCRRKAHSIELPHLYLGLWIGISFIVLALQKTRLPLYVLPLFPPLSMYAADILHRRWLGKRELSFRWIPRWIAAAVLLYAIVFVAGKWYYGSTVEKRDPRRCFRSVAHIIEDAAKSDGRKPIVYTKEGKLGYGIMFYLQSSRLVRVGETSSSLVRSRPISFRQVLAEPEPPDSSQYFLIEHKDAGHTQELFSQKAVMIGQTPAYQVWKRREESTVTTNSEPPKVAD